MEANRAVFFHVSLNQPGFIKIRTSALFSETVFTYLTAFFAAVSKRDVHWVALKHRLNTWILAHFYYVDIGTYCCFYYVATGRLRIAAVQNSNIQTVAKILCSIVLEKCPTPNPTLNLHDSVNKYKTDITMYLLMQPCHINLLICIFELLCRSVVTQDSNRSSSPPKYVSLLCELPNKPTVYENP